MGGSDRIALRACNTHANTPMQKRGGGALSQALPRCGSWRWQVRGFVVAEPTAA